MQSFHSEPIPKILGTCYYLGWARETPFWERVTLLILLLTRGEASSREVAEPKLGHSTLPPFTVPSGCLCLVLQRDVVPENEAEQISVLPPHPATPPTSIYPYPTAPPPLSTLTLLAVLHCTILSQQAVQYLRVGGSEYGCPEYPKSSLGTPLTPKHWESLRWGLNMLPAWSALSQVLMLVVIHQNFFTECTSAQKRT